MSLTDQLNMVVDLMKSIKEKWVDSDPENTDLAIYIHFFRGDSLVATAQCPLDRDTGLQAASLGAGGYDATAITMTFESYWSPLENSPLTGKPWIPKEKQFIAETMSDAAEKDWVYPCLTTTAHARDGEYGLHSQCYILHDRKVEWRDPQQFSSLDEGAGGGGIMFDHLQSVMSMPTMSQLLATKAKSGDSAAAMVAGLFDDEPERRQFHIDMATTTALQERELVIGVMLMAEDGSDRHKWLIERLGTENVSVLKSEDE